MSNNSKKSTQIEGGVGTGGSVGAGEGNEGNVPVTRQRVRYNKYGEELTGDIGTRFPKKLYQEYRDRAHFRRVFVRDLIRDAMLAYLPELKKSQRQKLMEAGQQELIGG